MAFYSRVCLRSHSRHYHCRDMDKIMNKQPETKKEKDIEVIEKEDFTITPELERWMTESTDPRLVPRSDCG